MSLIEVPSRLHLLVTIAEFNGSFGVAFDYEMVSVIQSDCRKHSPANLIDERAIPEWQRLIDIWERVAKVTKINNVHCRFVFYFAVNLRISAITSDSSSESERIKFL